MESPGIAEPDAFPSSAGVGNGVAVGVGVSDGMVVGDGVTFLGVIF